MEHLAVFEQGTLLDNLLTEKKTVESRFSVNKALPFGKVKVGDRVFLKVSGGEVIGEFRVGKVTSLLELTPQLVHDVLTQHKDELGLSNLEYFYEQKKGSRYGTLIWVKDLVKYSRPFSINKKGQQSWVILDSDTKGKYRFPEF